MKTFINFLKIFKEKNIKKKKKINIKINTKIDLEKLFKKDLKKFLKKKVKKNLKKKIKKNLKKNIIYKKKKKSKNRKYRLKKKRKKLSLFNKMFALGKFSIYYNILFTYKPFHQKTYSKLKKKQKKIKNKIQKNNSILNKNNFVLKKKKYKFILNLNLRINNIFINLIRYRKRKTLKKSFTTIKFWSTGLFGLICSRKRIKFIIATFLKAIKQKLNKIELYLIKINGPKFYVKLTYRSLKRFAFKSKYVIVNSFKIFNGCRFRKMKRKKHLKFFIYR